jgi:HEAT repeat protein
MGKYAHAMATSGLGLPGEACTPAAEIPRILELTYDDDPKVRRLAAKNLCACHVRADHPEVWARVFELLEDPVAGVRSDAIHALGDGSPRHLADEIAQALDGLRNDPDRDVRRRVRKVLQHYRRTGGVNVL